MGLKFLTTELHESLEFLVEEQNKTEPQKYFISGPYMMAEKQNQNGRVYQLDEMKREVERYSKDMILTRRAIGEMNHPQSTEVNPVNACHLVVELKQNDNYFMGKSLILDTPMGLMEPPAGRRPYLVSVLAANWRTGPLKAYWPGKRVLACHAAVEIVRYNV